MSKTSKSFQHNLWEVNNLYRECVDVFNSGTLKSPVFKYKDAVFTKLLILMSDILMFLDGNKKRINTKKYLKGHGVKDVTDLICKTRNAACHIRTSGENQIDTNKFICCIIFGKGKAVEFGNASIESEFNDDIAYCYGDKVVYLNRHIKTVLEEIPKRLNELSKHSKTP